MIIDVGANQGEFILDIARKNPDIECLAIEPVPELAKKIMSFAVAQSLTNLNVVVAAIHQKEQSMDLQISSGEDMGGSSLLEFDNQLIQNDQYWKNRTDLSSNKKIPVQTMTLKNILKIYKPTEKIDFIKIDVQGLDVEAMYSLGRRRMRQVQMGMLEVPSTLGSNLYFGQQYDLRKCLNKLKSSGFYVYAIKANDPAANEINVYFARKGVAHEALEKRFGLRTNEIYGGKWFWTHPTKTI